MAVVIRLQRKGTTKKPTYRVVVADCRKPTNGKILENVGVYYPRNEEHSQINLAVDRIQHWVSKGAQPTITVRTLLRKIKKSQTK